MEDYYFSILWRFLPPHRHESHSSFKLDFYILFPVHLSLSNPIPTVLLSQTFTSFLKEKIKQLNMNPPVSGSCAFVSEEEPQLLTKTSPLDCTSVSCTFQRLHFGLSFSLLRSDQSSSPLAHAHQHKNMLETFY